MERKGVYSYSTDEDYMHTWGFAMLSGRKETAIQSNFRSSLAVTAENGSYGKSVKVNRRRKLLFSTATFPVRAVFVA